EALEEPEDLRPVDPREEAGPESAVAVFSRRRAAKPDQRVGDHIEQPGHGIFPPPATDLRQEVYVDVAVARVTEDHHRELPRRRRLADHPNVLAHPRQ